MATTSSAAVGTFLVVRKSVLARFDFGAPGASYTTELLAYQAAVAFKSGYRRAERCAIVRAYEGETSGTVIVAAEKPEPGHAPGGTPVGGTAAKKSAEDKPKLSKAERRAARKERKKLALLDVIQMVREATFKELHKLYTEDGEAAVRREALKELRARQSHEKSARIYHWKASGRTVVIKTPLDAFR
jgi:hypothetical protein